MKKVLFLVALVLMSAGTFAQKKNVSRAKNLALMEENPDFANARVAIGEALENEETKVWQYSTHMLYSLFEQEEINGDIQFPDV